MSGFSAYQSSPVTQQAVVTVNAGFDRFFASVRKAQPNDKTDRRYLTSDDNCYTVQQRELVFRLNPRYNEIINRPEGFNGVNDMALKVFSSANRFPDALRFRQAMARTDLSKFSRETILRDAISFVGVAMQPVDYMQTNSKDTLAVQVAGSCTIWNTGTKVIRPGQKIVWDFPSDPSQDIGVKRKQIAGEPQSKRLFMTMPLESCFGNTKSINHDFVSALFDIHDPFNPQTDEAKSLAESLGPSKAQYTDFARKVCFLYEEVRSRVIGIALSGAAPGESFDVMLCSGH